MNRRSHIAIAEPSAIIRSGLASVLKKSSLNIDIIEIGEMGQLTNTLVKSKPDVLIISPTNAGVVSLKSIKDKMDGCGKIIALQSALTDPLTLNEYDDNISLYDSADEIKRKLEKAINNNDESQDNKQELSQREKEIITFVVKGFSNKQIAERLCLSVHTVMTHRRNISNKLEIHSSAGLTIYAIVNKLVALDQIKDGYAE